MAAKASWEVDPETKSKLKDISKKEGASNENCCDCGQASPQWASPKFGTFICLQCAGPHRGLGVHVSFVRSTTMDAFKQNEILRMQYGGNKAYQEFFTKNSTTTFEESTIKERYDCELGEEYKERLTAKVEDREFDKAAWSRERAAILAKQASRAATPMGAIKGANGSNTTSRTGSPAPGKQTLSPGQKAQNEAYFERMGSANAGRPDNLPPSQGGKYGGFGSGQAEPSHNNQSGIPSADDFAKDPVGALTRGFGWFGSAVTKQAKIVNDSYIQPTAQNLAKSDLTSQARNAAFAASQSLQAGAKGAASQFNKFVEGQDEGAKTAASQKGGADPERKDFWDSFGQSSDPPKSSSIGTSAMKKTASDKKKESDGWGTEDW